MKPEHDKKLEEWRKDTPGATNRIHLNNAGAALMPRPVIEAVRAHWSLEMQIGGYEAAALQQEALDRFYLELSKMLHARPDQIAFTANATDAYARALSSIPFSEGDYIVTTQDDYVSNHLAFLQLQKRFGVRVIVANVQERGGVDLVDLRQKVLKFRPRLLAVTHVPTNSGLVQDVEAAGQISREAGCWYLVDACQSAGQLPLDVEQIGCDFLTATFRKFLRGPRGVGFLYVSDRVLETGLEPLFVDLRGAQWIDKQGYSLAGGARRFELWERSWALVAGAREAVAYANSIGIDRIATRVKELASYTRIILAGIPGVQVLDAGPELCGIVTLAIPGWREPRELIEALRSKRINTSISNLESARFDFQRKQVDWALRLSPHYYNTKEELEKTKAVLEEVLQPRT